LISGKWWGDKSIQPFLCLHGWQDNAGTFDRLIPLLSKEFSYLAIDFPGHGRSSKKANGLPYYSDNFLFVINYVYHHYKWEKVSLIGHSLGARMIFAYTAAFPERVEMAIAIDLLAPTEFKLRDYLQLASAEYCEKLTSAHEQFLDPREPPSFELDALIDKVCQRIKGNFTSDNALSLLRRMIEPSAKYPGKYFLSVDRKINYIIPLSLPHAVVKEFAKNLNIPYLFIKASNSKYDYPNELDHQMEIIDILKHNSRFHCKVVESSSHHLHMTDSEKVAPVINQFIGKYKALKAHF
jgi:pimeloyl-ACP methyl ester carboxylesterase